MKYILLVFIYLGFVNNGGLLFAQTSPEELHANASLLVKKGNTHKNKGEYMQADSCYLLALEARQRLKDTLGIASIYNCFALLEKHRGNYNVALNWTDEAIKVLETKKDNKILGRVYINRGCIFSKNNKCETAFIYFDKAIELLKDIDIEGVAKAEENIAFCYDEMEDYSKALYFYEKAKNSYTKQEDIIRINDNIGVCYWHLNKLETALSYFKECVEQARTNENKLLLGNALINVIGVHTDLKQPEEVEKYLVEVQDLYKNEPKNLQQKLNFALTFSSYFDSVELPEQALAYHEEAYELNESIHEEEDAKALINAEIELGLVEAELENQKMLTGLIFLLLCIGLLSFIVFKYKRKQKQYEAQINDELSAAKLKGEKLGRKRISAELHDNISTILVAVKRDLELTLLKFSKGKDIVPVINKTIVIADKAYNRVRDLSHALDPSPVDWLDDLDIHIRLLEENEQFQVEKSIDIDQPIPIEIGGEISKIAGVLLHNVEKHSKATEVFIELTSFDEGINLMIVDNGVGFNQENIAHKKGIGIKNIKDRVEELNGSCKIDNRLGTTITIDIPLKQAS